MSICPNQKILEKKFLTFGEVRHSKMNFCFSSLYSGRLSNTVDQFFALLQVAENATSDERGRSNIKSNKSLSGNKSNDFLFLCPKTGLQC